jgi:TRAP-type C4-dicarboxylate transport system permease small subunit
VRRILDRCLWGLLIALVGILTVCVFLQVLIRFVFKFPIPWTEEVSRIAFVYIIFVGATIAVRDKTHINVDVLLVMLPSEVTRWIQRIGLVLVAGFLIFMIWQGIIFVRATGVQVTPVMQLPFRHLYLIIPSSGALMLLYLILGVADEWRQQGRQP